MVEELDLLLMLAAGRVFWRGSSLATTTWFLGATFGSSPSLWLWCSVLLCALLVCVFCGGVRFGVLCINYFFFLNDAVVLLTFIKKKKSFRWPPTDD
jgi:hypothetical protein